MQINFEPIQLKKANKKLDKHVLSAHAHKEANDEYKRGVFKESLWTKFVGLFKR
jgi:hypothetical protein